MRTFLALVVVVCLAAAGVFVFAGRAAGPQVEIARPDRFVGLSTPLEIAVTTPRGELTELDIALEQNGKVFPLFAMSDLAGGGTAAAEMRHDGDDRVRVTRDIGRQSIPELQSGPARITVTAARPVLYGARTTRTTEARDVEVRLERPRLAVLSTHHHVNHGGAEVVVYRVTPHDVTSGVVVGEVEYPGYPAAGIDVDGVQITDPAIRIAFFALLSDQDLNTPIRLFARDEAGNTARADFDHRVFPKPFRRSRIDLDDRFLDRVVPAILEGTDEVRPDGSTLEKFLVINDELRRRNNDRIASFREQTVPELLWRGEVFYPFTSTAVQSAFADQRTYYYKGQEVDRQVHLGFDLASLAGAPIVAGNRGRVLFADELGIYGNTVIVDHGMGVQSLYAHLSSIGVEAGQMVEKRQEIGRSGMTGMAGGDHLHFTMLVHGGMVSPIEWWDPQWIRDRILRKLRAIGAT